MKAKKEITIYDIAHKLNLSSATIGHPLKNHPAINKKTNLIIRISSLKKKFLSEAL